MKIVFYASDKPRELALAKAFAAGAKKHKHRVEVRTLGDISLDADLSCMVGVKSIGLWNHLNQHGKQTLMFDKGYSRHRKGGCWEYWRVSLGAHHPTETTLTGLTYPSDRFDGAGWKLERWGSGGDHILLAGSSEKYHNFYGLCDPNAYAENVVATLRQYTDRQVIYRPKPSWRGALPIDGASFSPCKQSLAEVLRNCYAVVTHGSNACFEAALNGIPSIILGNAVMRPISSTKLKHIERVRRGNRAPIFNALAYHQWTLTEFTSGIAFTTIGTWL